MKRLLAGLLVLALTVSIVGMITSKSAVVADSTTQTELFYDDGELNYGWFATPLHGGAVLFTPPTTPWVLSKIKVMAWYGLDDAPFFIEIWDSDQQELYNVTYMYSDYFTSYPWDWVEIEIPLIVVEGDFYVGIFGNSAETHYLALCADNNPPISYRSFVVWYPNNFIERVKECNWMIRAIGAPLVQAAIDFDPDTLNLKSKGKVVTVYIELPEGYDVEEIDISTIMLNGIVPALAHPTDVGDYDSDGVLDLMVKFDRSNVQDMLEPGNEVEIELSGQLTDGTSFEGADTIRVIAKGKK